MTRVAVARRDIERAAEATNTMVDRAQGMESVRLNRRFGVIANTLRPQESAAARAVVERIDASLSVPI